MNTNRNSLAFLIGALLAYVCSACAPLPPAGLSLLGCQENQPCVIVQVQNDNFYEAAVTANGRLIGHVGGNGHGTLSVPVIALEPPGCASFRVRLIDGYRQTVATSKECVRPGQRFDLWITPNIAGTNVTPRE